MLASHILHFELVSSFVKTRPIGQRCVLSVLRFALCDGGGGRGGGGGIGGGGSGGVAGGRGISWDHPRLENRSFSTFSEKA